MATSPVLTAGGTAQNTRGKGPGEEAPRPTVPFIRASQQHRESAFDVSRQMTASDQDLGVFDIPAYGYIRAIVLLVTTTGGTAAAAPGLNEDAPFSALKNIAFHEPNGAAPFQVQSGYSVYLINKYGGYRGWNDPRSAPGFSVANTTTPGFQFLLRIPIELSTRDGLGSLPNQNSAAQFKLRLTLAKLTDVFTGALTAAPTVRVQGFVEAWDQPSSDSQGALNQVTPPAMNTTQFWSEQVLAPGQSLNTLRLTRVGNFLRNVILVNRRAAGTRVNGDTDWPNPLEVLLDARSLDSVEKNNWHQQMYERYGYGANAVAKDAAGGLDSGVFAYDFMHEFDGVAGHENRDLWLPTLGSTRLELRGTWGQAGSLTVLTNDVSVAGTVFI